MTRKKIHRHGTKCRECAVNELEGIVSDIRQRDIINSLYAPQEALHPAVFPELYTLSSAFFYQLIAVAKNPAPPEVVFVPVEDKRRVDLVGVIASWNNLWEASQFRGELFKSSRYEDMAPEFVNFLRNLPQANIYLVPDTPYDAYAPLFHLLPKSLLDRHGLPAVNRPLWPSNGCRSYDEILPRDFSRRIGNALSDHLWPYLCSGSRRNAFSPAEPLVVLSHNVEFWIPYALQVIEGRMRQFERTEVENDDQRKWLARAESEPDPDAALETPRKGGSLWMGQEEAAWATEDMVNAADKGGHLRGIVEAIRSNRVVDDFSSHWSFAREDFERKLYQKRSRVKVSFVELKDTLPVHSPRSEYTDGLIWQDFSALLDKRERHIVVCLRNGTTNLQEIATSLGYVNHSPISKALAQIRRKARAFMN
jgi:hypothetical protein